MEFSRRVATSLHATSPPGHRPTTTPPPLHRALAYQYTENNRASREENILPRNLQNLSSKPRSGEFSLTAFTKPFNRRETIRTSRYCWRTSVRCFQLHTCTREDGVITSKREVSRNCMTRNSPFMFHRELRASCLSRTRSCARPF